MNETSTIESKIEALSTTLKRIANRYANDKVSADDIYQGMVEKIITTCSFSDTKSYICQLATWTARNMVNAERIYMRYVTTGTEQDTDEGDVVDFADIFSDANAVSPEQHLVEIETEEEMSILLAKVIANLDPTNKQIVYMLASNHTHQSIADKLNITRQAVTNRVHDLRGIFQMAGLSPAMLSA